MPSLPPPRAPRHGDLIAGWSAVATAVLFMGANALWVFEQPGLDASAGNVVRFYDGASGRVIAGGLLSLVSMALLLVFAGSFRPLLMQLEGDEVGANVALGGTLMLVATGLGAETINMAAAVQAGAGHLGVALGQALFETSYVLGYNAAGVGLGVLSIAVGRAALRSHSLLPPWVALLAIVLGVALLTPLSQDLLGAGFLLIAVVGVQVLRGPSADGSSSDVSRKRPRQESNLRPTA